MFGDDATVEILIQWKQQNERVTAEVLAQLETQKLAIGRLNDAYRDEAKAATEAAVANKVAANNTSFLGQAMAAINGPQGWAQFAVYAGLAAVALAPFSAVVLSSAVALTSFAVAGTGMLATLGGAAALFLGLAAAAFLLADATGKLDVTVGGTASGGASQTLLNRQADTQRALANFNALHTGALTLAQQQQQTGLGINASRAQAAVDAANSSAGVVSGGQSVNQLSLAFQNLAQTLGEQALPMAREMIGFIEGQFPLITKFATEIMSWFQDRLPGALSAFGVTIRNLTPYFQEFGQFFGDAFDQVSGQIGPMFEDAVKNVLIPATEGAITNLMRLSDWFQKELPTLGPVVQQIFGGMGTFIQGVASDWAKFNDWIVKNWKPTTDEAAKDWKNITEGWKGVDFTGLSSGLMLIGQGIKGIGDAASVAIGALGPFIKSLQDWANNNGFWSNLQTDLLNLANAIRGGYPGLGGPAMSPPTNVNPARSGGNQYGAAISSMVAGQQPASSKTQTNYIAITTSPGQDPAVTARALTRALANV